MQSNNIAGNRGNSVISWKVPRNELSIDHQRNGPLIAVTAGRCSDRGEGATFLRSRSLSPAGGEGTSFKDAKEARNKRIFDLWMACHTQQEIGKEFEMTPQAVGQVLKESADLPKLSKPDQADANHATERKLTVVLPNSATLPNSVKLNRRTRTLPPCFSGRSFHRTPHQLRGSVDPREPFRGAKQDFLYMT